MQEYCGQIRNTFMNYYNARTKKTGRKARPMLFIKAENDTMQSDYTTLPVSKVTCERYRDSYYDEIITKNDFPDTNLNDDPSYIRCHKISTVSAREVDKTNFLCDFKKLYPEKYDEVVKKAQQYLE